MYKYYIPSWVFVGLSFICFSGQFFFIENCTPIKLVGKECQEKVEMGRPILNLYFRYKIENNISALHYCGPVLTCNSPCHNYLPIINQTYYCDNFLGNGLRIYQWRVQNLWVSLLIFDSIFLMIIAFAVNRVIETKM